MAFQKGLWLAVSKEEVSLFSQGIGVGLELSIVFERLGYYLLYSN
jgi:hypothetical protein